MLLLFETRALQRHIFALFDSSLCKKIREGGIDEMYELVFRVRPETQLLILFTGADRDIRVWMTKRTAVKCELYRREAYRIFTTMQLHVMQRTVCPSVCRTRRLWQNERNLCPRTTRMIIYPSFLRRRMVGEDDPFKWNFGPTDPDGVKTPIFNGYSLVEPQPYNT